MRLNMDKKVAILIVVVVIIISIIGGNYIAKNMRQRTNTITQRETNVQDDFTKIIDNKKIQGQNRD